MIVPEIDDRFAEIARLQGILMPLGYPTDVMVYSTQEVAERGKLPGSPLRWALEEGRLLYAAP